MENSEIAVLETAVTELLREQQETNRLLADLVTEIKTVGEKVTGYDEKLKTQKVVSPPIDITPILQNWNLFAQKVEKTVEGQPKTVIHQRRFLLFPETNAGYYYKIVFGRLIPWALLFIGITYLFCLCKQYVDQSAEASNRRYYYETYQKAWNRLDTLLGPTGRKLMDKAMKQAAEGE